MTRFSRLIAVFILLTVITGLRAITVNVCFPQARVNITCSQYALRCQEREVIKDLRVDFYYYTEEPDDEGCEDKVCGSVAGLSEGCCKDNVVQCGPPRTVFAAIYDEFRRCSEKSSCQGNLARPAPAIGPTSCGEGDRVDMPAFASIQYECTSDTGDADADKDEINIAVIVIPILCAVIVILAAVIVFLWIRRRKKSKNGKVSRTQTTRRSADRGEGDVTEEEEYSTINPEDMQDISRNNSRYVKVDEIARTAGDGTDASSTTDDDYNRVASAVKEIVRDPNYSHLPSDDYASSANSAPVGVGAGECDRLAIHGVGTLAPRPSLASMSSAGSHDDYSLKVDRSLETASNISLASFDVLETSIDTQSPRHPATEVSRDGSDHREDGDGGSETNANLQLGLDRPVSTKDQVDTEKGEISGDNKRLAESDSESTSKPNGSDTELPLASALQKQGSLSGYEDWQPATDSKDRRTSEDSTSSGSSASEDGAQQTLPNAAATGYEEWQPKQDVHGNTDAGSDSVFVTGTDVHVPAVPVALPTRNDNSSLKSSDSSDEEGDTRDEHREVPAKDAHQETSGPVSEGRDEVDRVPPKFRSQSPGFNTIMNEDNEPTTEL